MATLESTRVFALGSRPAGMPSSDNFRLEERPLAGPADGELTVEMHYLSVDPYMRGRMRDGPSYAPPVEVGGVMVGGGVGRVVASRSAVSEGSYVVGNFGWREHATVPANSVRVVDPGLAPISTSLGVLGMPGLTAYFGVKDICAVREGDSFAVSGAAGAVGSVAGQIARNLGCHVAGTAGSAGKVSWIRNDLGFDAAFDYREADDLGAAWREVCPSGVDAYFDNVGGPITDALFPSLNIGARIAICGQIAQYNAAKPELGPRLFGHLIVKRARVQGFLIFDFEDRYREGIEALAGWIADGKLRYQETIVDGFENMPDAFLGLFRGDNTGKQLVKLAAAEA